MLSLLVLLFLCACSAMSPTQFAAGDPSAANQGTALDDASQVDGGNPTGIFGNDSGNTGGNSSPGTGNNVPDLPAPPIGGGIDVASSDGSNPSTDAGTLVTAPVITCIGSGVCNMGPIHLEERVVTLYYSGRLTIPQEYQNPDLAACDIHFPQTPLVEIWRSDDQGLTWNKVEILQANPRTGNFQKTFTDLKKLGPYCESFIQFKSTFQDEQGRTFHAESPVLKCEAQLHSASSPVFCDLDDGDGGKGEVEDDFDAWERAHRGKLPNDDLRGPNWNGSGPYEF